MIKIKSYHLICKSPKMFRLTENGMCGRENLKQIQICMIAQYTFIIQTAMMYFMLIIL